jgi:hypothetical protein
MYSLALIIFVVAEKKAYEHFPIGFNVNLCPAVAAILANLAGMFLGWSSTKCLFFVPVGYSTWLSGPIICSD